MNGAGVLQFKTIAAEALSRAESLVSTWLPDGSRQGDEWVARNPHRDDRKAGSFSVNLKTGVWREFAGDEGGADLVSLYAFLFTAGSQKEAAVALGRDVGVSVQRPSSTPRKATAPRPALPLPAGSPAPPAKHFELGAHSGEWIYRSHGGEELYRVRRYDTAQGKEYRPLSFKDGKWTWGYPSEPRPLYGLERLADVNKSSVLVVEGEKAADAAARLFPTLAVVTSPAGAKAAKKADWTPLQHHNVVIWPDNDGPGLEFAAEVHALLKELGVAGRVVDVPKGWPVKWDLADQVPVGVGPFTLQEMIDQAQPWSGSVPGTEAPKVKLLDVLTWADFKGKPIPPLEWIWEPFLPKISFGILASLPKHGKSILSLQVSVALAAGLPLFGFPTCGPAGVGILALEDDPKAIHRRLSAIVEAYGQEWTPEHDRRLEGNLRILVRSRLELESLSATAQEFHLVSLAMELGTAMRSTVDTPALLFLDTLNAVHDGDENSAQETRPLIAAINSLNATLGCSVWPLHHLRKAGIGRNAPSLEDRVSSELIRGSGAILAGARGTAQFGWISPQEAKKVGLEPLNSARRYAIFCLTTVNDGPASPWILLEHSKNAGIWAPVPGGDQKLAELRGGQEAVKALNQLEALLVDLHHGIRDRKELIQRHWPDLAPEDAEAKLKNTLSDMRKVKRGWVQSGKLDLTAAGFLKAQALCLTQDIRSGEPSTQPSNPEEDGASNDAA